MLEKIMSEKGYEEIAKKVLKDLTKKIKEEIADSFYLEMEGWLYDQYANVQDKIERELIYKITERFVKEPGSYKFAELRKKMFKENKEELVRIMTKEVAKERLEEALLEYTNKDYWLSHNWLDGIVNLICKHWDKFEGNEKINRQIINKLESKQQEIEYYKNKIRELENVSKESEE